VRRLAEILPHVGSLRDVTLHELEQHRARMSEAIYRRCRHVVTENERVHGFVAALQDGDTDALGRLMADSHRSLRDDYEASCAELDLMVDLARRQPGAIGARMTGGGFGGSTINLVNATDAAQFQRGIGAAYFAATGLRPDIYVCKPAPGAGPVLLPSGQSSLRAARGPEARHD
jgi:galactokinase